MILGTYFITVSALCVSDFASDCTTVLPLYSQVSLIEKCTLQRFATCSAKAGLFVNVLWQMLYVLIIETKMGRHTYIL